MNSGKSPSVDPHVQNILSRVTKTWPPRGTSKPRIRVFAPLRVKTKGKSAQPWWLFLAGPLLAPRTTAVNSRLLHRCLFFAWVWLRRPCKRDLCHVSGPCVMSTYGRFKGEPLLIQDSFIIGAPNHPNDPSMSLPNLPSTASINICFSRATSMMDACGCS